MTFRLGAVPGATPGKWIRTWQERMRRVPLELVTIDFERQRESIITGEVDAALVRQPIEREDLHFIPLYEEVPVVVIAAESHLNAADELSLSDLAGELLIVPGDNVLGPLDVPDARAPDFPEIATSEDAIATVPSIGAVCIVPMSIARLHHRKDVSYRPLVDGPLSPVGLSWLIDNEDENIQTFIGIVRGRTVNSSRR